MITLTVKIADSGTVYGPNGESFVGHMWISIDPDGATGSMTPISMGFAPTISSPIWLGAIHDDDDEKYASTYYTGTIIINDTQYNQLIDFKESPAYYGLR
jgi:hypothetical protein